MKNKSSLYYSLTIFIIGFFLYSNTLNHGYVLDDFSVIKENTVVKRGVEGIPTIWKTHYRFGYGYIQANLYRPLTLSLFAIQWEFFPNKPSFAHWFNVLLYALLGIVVFLFLYRLLGKEYQLLSFLSSVLFVSHPIHTEVVANIKSTDDILAMGFSLLSVLALFKYLQSSNKAILFLSLFLSFLGFVSKESTLTIMLSIPLILVLFKNLNFKKAVTISFLYLIPFGAYLIMRMRVLGSISGDKTIAGLDNLLVTAPNYVIKLATTFKILGLYLIKLLFPHPLMNDYSINQIKLVGFSSIWPWLSIAVYSLLVYLIIRFWKKAPIIAFGISFFLITLSLYSNLFFTIGTSFGERLLFIPSLGFALIVAYLILILFKKESFPNHVKSAKWPLFLVGLVTIAYSFKTIDRNKAWKDNFTLYSTDVLNCNESARCQYYFGLGLMKEKALSERNSARREVYYKDAVNAFKEAIYILPTYSDAWGQLGLAYYRLKNYRAAENAYLKATEYNPANATAYSNLGSLYFELEKYAAAKNALKKAVSINPNHLDALYNYASTLGTLGDFNNAVIYYKKAIDINPKNPNYHQMLAVTYQNLGNQTQANIYYQKAKNLRESN